MSQLARGSERAPAARATDGGSRRRVARWAALALLCGSPVSPADGAMQGSASVRAMAASAARVFRGHCRGARTEVVEVAGARLPVTTYTFEVGEHLKGTRRRTLTFRQVGAPDGGPRDLGRLAGLPVYLPGTEYVLFLLPASRAGLTSPAGAGEGAFVVRGTRVRRMGGARHRPGDVAAAEPATYEALRRAVRDAGAR